ncbi:helix-turn-helix transcriptional regulator [Pseudomonas entomophila]|uniref:helix-turn-helix domain-containing protein n=1 Tax=Pseudomonas entomophila TaxID=312306 RepID=UPI0015E28BE7|nr:helix-turn-helix transcriptional regulator [Pseudomonas entomophila]MBA1188072.1 helix-turn-helix transcriptional regulator [Pseudomonas entomophila]
MKFSHHSTHEPDPALYLRLGELIASAGEASFAEQLFAFVGDQVPIQGLDLQEWSVHADPRRVRVSRTLGQATPEHPPRAPEALAASMLDSVLDMEAPLLVQYKAAQDLPRSARAGHACSVVSCRGPLRWVIGFHRSAQLRGFSLSELSLLKVLSDTLLPLVEQHAQMTPLPAPTAGTDDIPVDPGSLRSAFAGRLAHQAVTLSAREQEVCLGLLTGVTVPELAERLKVKGSSVETYLKRATAKLGVSGRRGLTRWMVGV